MRSRTSRTTYRSSAAHMTSMIALSSSPNSRTQKPPPAPPAPVVVRPRPCVAPVPGRPLTHASRTGTTHFACCAPMLNTAGRSHRGRCQPTGREISTPTLLIYPTSLLFVSGRAARRPDSPAAQPGCPADRPAGRPPSPTSEPGLSRQRGEQHRPAPRRDHELMTFPDLASRPDMRLTLLLWPERLGIADHRTLNNDLPRHPVGDRRTWPVRTAHLNSAPGLRARRHL